MTEKTISRRRLVQASALSATVFGASAQGAAAAAADIKAENKGKVAFITGGARGIGLRTAEVLANTGANIVLFDAPTHNPGLVYPVSTPAELNEAKKKIEALGAECLAVQGDVRNADQLNGAVENTVSRFGSLDIAFANAGILQTGPLENHTDDDIDNLLAINIGGVAKTIRAVTPQMREQNGGRIIATSSVAGRRGTEGVSVYSATKWAVISLIKTAALELGASNISCNAVCPTAIKTDMLDYVANAIDPERSTNEVMAEFVQFMHRLPVGPLDPVDLANVVAFLASEQSAHITGAAIDIDAGFGANNVA